MKSILITGASGYIAARLYEHLRERGYAASAVNLRGSLEETRFCGFDTVVHTAGLAHRLNDEPSEDEYFSVNCELAVKTAEAAKAQGVKQFIFLSSMSVYGLVTGTIDSNTPLNPATAYGRSKLAAEKALRELESEDFRVAVLRPPMVYGNGCKGNYPRLARLVLKLPFFPSVQNERSMIYIGCLCDFIRRLAESGEGGLYFPQNKEYVKTDELARQIALCHGKRLRLVRGFGRLIRLMSGKIDTIGKVFGSLKYDRALSAAFADEPQPDLAETVRLTEDKA